MDMKLKCLITLILFQQLFRSNKIGTFVFPFLAREMKVSTSLIMHIDQTPEGLYLLQIHLAALNIVAKNTSEVPICSTLN